MPLRAVEVYDTTLRDGTQREGISLGVEDKLRVARRLDALGVAFIEAGWPGSNPKDAEFFARARDLRLEHAVLTAFGSTRRAGARPEDDPGMTALLAADTAAVAIFGKTSVLHVDEVLRVPRAENLAMIEESVAFLRARGRRVIYDAEHFFDGLALDRDYALSTLAAAARGGAETLVLCDTNGGSLPHQIEEGVAAARSLGLPLGIHAHDDGGCAVANSVAAVRAGAAHVQGTMNGYGERCGNANLCVLMPNLELKLGVRCLPEGSLAKLVEAAAFVAETANLALDDHMAYVGWSAFAHKGGVHVAAMRRTRASYEHIDPALVGNASRVVVSELSGRGNVMAKAEEYGVSLAAGAEARVLHEIKGAEARGFSYEAAEASVALKLRRTDESYAAPFQLIDYRILCTPEGAEATLKVRIGARTVHTAAEGDGPVGALDAALRKALEPDLPKVAAVQLTDYKVRILDGRLGTAAIVRVLATCSDGHHSWSTVGAGASIVDASWQALADGIEFGLLDKGEKRRETDESDDRTASG